MTNPLAGLMLWVSRMEKSVKPEILKEKCLVCYTLMRTAGKLIFKQKYELGGRTLVQRWKKLTK